MTYAITWLRNSARGGCRSSPAEADTSGETISFSNIMSINNFDHANSALNLANSTYDHVMRGAKKTMMAFGETHCLQPRPTGTTLPPNRSSKASRGGH